MEQQEFDRIFKNNLELYDVQPDPKVWARIEETLDRKKEKKVLFLWWYSGGIAAALLLLFGLSLFLKKPEFINQNPIVEKEQKTPINKENPLKNNSILDTIKGAFTESELVNSKPKKSEDPNKDSSVGGTSQIQPNRNLESKLAARAPHTTLKSNKSKAVNSTDLHNKTSNESTLAQTQTHELAKQQGETENITEKKVSQNKLFAIQNERKELSLNERKKSENWNPLDTLENTKEKISIFEVIAEKEQKDIAANNPQMRQKWSIASSLAPVVMNAIGNGSPIHSSFSENEKTSNVTLSYGINVGYKISKKLEIRTGIHSVNMSYNTDEIEFTSSLQSSTFGLLENITYSANARSLRVQSQVAPNTNEQASLNANDVFGEIEPFEGRMVQQMQFVEFPVELRYALTSRKLGIHVIGGLSSYVLTRNEVLLSSDALVTRMGEANNMNEMSFSTNIGLGVNYQIANKLELQVEPIFKYQMNTFSNVEGNFQPYTLGIYSGLLFRF